jgi:hypothetical protein
MVIPKDLLPKVYALTLFDEVLIPVKPGSLVEIEDDYVTLYKMILTDEDGNSLKTGVVIPEHRVTGAAYDATDSD